MPFNQRKVLRYQDGMRRRIEVLRTRTTDSLDFAVDHMMEERVDSFFQVEQALEEIGRSLDMIDAELPLVCDLSHAIRLEARLEFVEDRWDDLDSEVRERPRRRRRRINLADFLKTAGGGGNSRDGTGPTGEVRTLSEAYDILGVEDGASLLKVTRAFRQRAKDLHPDAREGDRSAEPELRRIIEAYQFLKESLSLSNVEPPRHADAPFRPTE
ncbi:MAG: J domain-containing protein [Nitrospiraceae bacterium]